MQLWFLYLLSYIIKIKRIMVEYFVEYASKLLITAG